MGRTVPTFTMVLQQEIDSWSKFRRGLRKEDQDALDELFRAAHLQLAGSAYAARPIPFESVAMSMLLAQHRMIKALQEEVGRQRGKSEEGRGKSDEGRVESEERKTKDTGAMPNADGPSSVVS